MAKKIFAVFCNIFETTRKDILGVGRLQAYKYFNILTYRSIIRGRLHAKLRLTMLSIKKYAFDFSWTSWKMHFKNVTIPMCSLVKNWLFEFNCLKQECRSIKFSMNFSKIRLFPKIIFI